MSKSVTVVLPDGRETRQLVTGDGRVVMKPEKPGSVRLTPERRRIKQRRLDLIRMLLVVPGARTHWTMIAPYLDKMPLAIVNALAYRIERACAMAYVEGQKPDAPVAFIPEDVEPLYRTGRQKSEPSVPEVVTP